MEKNIKKGFTLIELLAVIIILAVVSLIAVPKVVDVINDAKESVLNSKIILYADSVKLARTKSLFTNETVDDNNLNNLELNLSNDSVSCTTKKYNDYNGVTLGGCTIKGESIDYCYTNNNVYSGESCKAPVISNVTFDPTITRGNVNLNVESSSLITDYSFDNGETWIDSSTFEATENGTYYVFARNVFDVISDVYSVNITNIDREGPTFTLDNRFAVEIGAVETLTSLVKSSSDNMTPST